MTLTDEFDAELAATEVGRCNVRKWLLADTKRAEEVTPLLLSERKAAQVVPFLEKRYGVLGFDDKGLLAHRRRLAGGHGCRCPVS